MKKDYKKFVVGETLYEAINKLPEGTKEKFAIYSMQYGIEYKEPSLEGVEAALWITLRDLIDNTRPKKGAPKGNVNAIKTNENKSIQLENKSIQLETNENKSGNLNINLNLNVNENENENEKEKEKEKPLSLSPFAKISAPEEPGMPDLPPKDYSQIFEAVKSRWKEITGQETREHLLTISPAKREKFINTLANYTLEEIANAIRNYWYTKNNQEEYDIGSRIYGTLYGFLESGVGQFHCDKMVRANFRRQKNVG